MNKAKKSILLVALLAIVTSLTLSGAAYALDTQTQNIWEKGNVLGVCANPQAPGAHYIDANGDGICDQRGNTSCPGYLDTNADGICDNYGTPGYCGALQGNCATGTQGNCAASTQGNDGAAMQQNCPGFQQLRTCPRTEASN
ncbi:MAG: hypothetical protein LBP91_05070 [Coriobacteriales bacterium]|jgi:hypothetical protein|nr:hypothetical protein [Coriobacteriales bacterium]